MSRLPSPDIWEILSDARDAILRARRDSDDLDEALEAIAQAEEYLAEARTTIQSLQEQRRESVPLPITGSRDDWRDRDEE